MPQHFPNALKFFKDFKDARQDEYEIACEDLNPRHPRGYGYQQLDEDDREGLYASMKDLRFSFGFQMRELLVPEDHPTPQRAVASILELRETIYKDYLEIQAMAQRYPAGLKQPPPITYILKYEQDVIDMLDYILGMDEVVRYLPTVRHTVVHRETTKRYCILQSADDDILGAEPHFGVDSELMLLMGRKYLEGGGEVKYGGRTYAVSGSIYIVFEHDPTILGTTPKEVMSYLNRLVRERKQSLFARVDESLLSGFGNEVTQDVLDQLEDESKAAAAITAAQGATVFDFWQLMHPKVVDASKKLFVSGHARQAVQDAFIALEENIRRTYSESTGEHRIGAELMVRAFGGESAIIQLFPTSDSSRAEKQEGYMHIFQGVMMAIRNPKSLSLFEVEDIDAIDMLFIASRLFKKLDSAEYPMRAGRILQSASIGVLAALPKEYQALQQVLGATEVTTVDGQGTGRRYACATIPGLLGRRVEVVVAMLPAMGNNHAAIRANQLLQHCPNVKHIIMCGIAGAVPFPANPENHVRLGDVVVSGEGGVVQYDMTKDELSGVSNRSPARPPSALLVEAFRHIEAEEGIKVPRWHSIIQRLEQEHAAWQRPTEETDVLKDDPDQPPTPHPIDSNRIPGMPRVFSGTIAAANVLLKNPARRNDLRDRFKVKAVEMEGSGIADATWTADAGYLVIRGTCDYCNSTKNDVWQNYAALVAAAYCRRVIEEVNL